MRCFSSQRRVPQLPARGAPRVLRGETRGAMLLRREFPVERDLVCEILLTLPAMQQIGESAQEPHLAWSFPSHRSQDALDGRDDVVEFTRLCREMSAASRRQRVVSGATVGVTL